MKKQQLSYSLDQVKEKMANYLDASETRLRNKLKAAWKKQNTAKAKIHEAFTV